MKNNRSNSLLLLALFVVPFATVAWAGAKNDPDLMKKQAIWEKAFNEQDPELGGAQYTEDAIFMIPNSESIVGREAIAATFADPALEGMTLELNHKEAITQGKLGYVYGTYVMNDPDGNQVDDGKYMEIHHKVDGEWLMHRDIYNSNQPPAEADYSENMKAVSEFVSVWNDKSYEKLAEIMTPNARRIGPQGKFDGTGPDGFKNIIGALHTSYPDFAVTIVSEDYFPGGALLKWNATGTNTGPGENPPTNKAIDLKGLTKMTFEDGKISEELVMFDMMTWMQQLGQLPAVP